MNTSEKSENLFTNTMSALLSEISAIVSQESRYNLKKGFILPGKSTQLFESDFKPLMDQEALEALISKSPNSKQQRIQPFHNRQILNPAIYDTEYRRSSTNFRPAEAESQSERTILEDGDADIHLQNDPQEGFPDVNRPQGCFHVHLDLQAVHKVPLISLERPLIRVPRPAIRAITDPVDLYEDPPPSSRMSQVERNSSLGIPRRPDDYGGNPRTCQFREVVDYAVSVDHTPWDGDQHERNFPQSSIRQDPGSPTRSYQISQHWLDDIEMSGELHRKGPVDFSRPASWVTDDTPTIKKIEMSSVSIELMEIDTEADETDNPEPVLVEETDKNIESLGNSSMKPLLLRDMEPQGRETTYQHEGTDKGALCTEAQECGGSISASILRKHKHTLLCQEIRGHYLPGTAGINRKDMDSLSQDQHCPQHTDSAKRMESIHADILSTELDVWTPRLRPRCIIPEQEARSILHLVPGQKSAGTECPDPQLYKIRRSVLLSTLESDSPGSSDDLVPRPDVTINLRAPTSSSNKFSSGSKKQKDTALGKQALELDGLEDQRCFLKTKDLGNYAIDFIVSKEQRVRRRFSRDPEAPIPKGRAIGAKLAAKSGISTADIV
ncbi:hypothetical protein AYI70_g7271 [Smittium culicis]|uniref:Uncharacterized protein n=1 Tax=Smittium culicis TaxID=133412 RepID=A0A1R1XLE1_9FUNG|nr:hypothetical protein AYI70_g7271 [Smittium culicis]